MNFDPSHFKLFLPGERSEAQELGVSVSIYRNRGCTRLLECPNMKIPSKRLCRDGNRRAYISNLSGVRH